MLAYLRLWPLLLPSFFLISCTSTDSGITPEDYQPVLLKLHAMECTHLAAAGKPTRYPDAYSFRSAAFQEILRDLNRNVLAEYESYYQQLADLEFRMNETEKEVYRHQTEELYQQDCQH
ncbi:hypothetical protein [Candidatus Pollutiaquabacter sp.]|uniref:hypothetical protein n=1 Tax=Candidatus Pollutiaquabacter sp. TaxID=3416354 RepID=UPI003CC475C0|nr:hypothetical protein [Bacteroidota bacterium]